MEFSVGIPLNYLKQAIGNINELIIEGKFEIDVKKLRRRAGISSSNRSMINFYWNILKFLEQKGFLFEIKNTKPKRYSLPKFSIDFDGLVKKI